MTLLALLLITHTQAKTWCDGIWIGLNDVAKDGEWEWESASCESTFLSWSEGEPNNWGGSEEYVGIPLWSGTGWNDFSDRDGLVCGCQQTTDVCGTGWLEFNNSICYIISENRYSWSNCSKWCDEMSAEMLCIENQQQDDFVRENIDCWSWWDECHDSCCDGMWIGYYEEQVDTWSWNWGSCNSNFTYWDVDQPGDNGGGESTAVIGHWGWDGTWHDVPGLDTGDWDGAVCACQKNGSSSCPDGWLNYTVTNNCYWISENTMTYVKCMETCRNLENSHMITCIRDQKENDFLYNNIGCSPSRREDDCWWEESILIDDVLWLTVGLPCFIVIFIVFLHMSGIVTLGMGVNFASKVGNNTNLDVDANGNITTNKSAYGRMLDAPEDVPFTNVDELLNRWILLGAAGEIVHAIALLGLGITMSMHAKGMDLSMYIDSAEAFICCLCKILVAKCGHCVHKRMSSISRKIVGPWVLIFSILKLLVAGIWFGLTIVCFILGIEWSNFCLASFLFFWGLLASTVLQTMTGFTLYRIHIRAAKKLQNNVIFYDIVGCWWATLVIGQFGVGVCVWLMGAGFFVFEKGGFEGIGTFALLASAFQVITGVSMLFINHKVRTYFSGPESSNTIQMMQHR